MDLAGQDLAPVIADLAVRVRTGQARAVKGRECATVVDRRGRRRMAVVPRACLVRHGAVP